MSGDDARHLQWLARSQVHAGRLAESYAAIQRMPAGAKYRVWPLVELAAAVARLEASGEDGSQALDGARACLRRGACS